MPTLIERLEAAAGPDRELDLQIDFLVRPNEWSIDVMSGGVGVNPYWYDNRELPPYTDSIDAARSICPDAVLIRVDVADAKELSVVRLVADTSTSPIVQHIGIASTIELAWCIAALRARGVK